MEKKLQGEKLSINGNLNAETLNTRILDALVGSFFVEKINKGDTVSRIHRSV